MGVTAGSLEGGRGGTFFPAFRDGDSDALASIAGVVFCDYGKLGG